MKNALWLVIVATAIPWDASADWVDMSRGLPERNIRAVAAGPSREVYVATKKRVFRWDGGQWLPLKGMKPVGKAIHDLAMDGKALYVASDKGIQSHSQSKWRTLYSGGIGPKQAVLCLFSDDDTHALYAGTEDGVVRIDPLSGQALPLEGLSGPVRSVVKDDRGQLWASSDTGIFVHDEQRGWRKLDAAPPQDQASLSQFDIEELASPWVAPQLIFMPGKGDVFMSRPSGALEGLTKKDIWDIGSGLPARSISTIRYDAASGDILIAGENGLYRYPKPELKLSQTPASSAPTVRDMLRRFEHEPSIRAVQEAAIRYAEVHPDKIKSWREAAAAKAWMPTLSLSADSSEDQNIDLDRGGTGDPDRFIVGPAEKSKDWSVGLSWDLGDLIWNDAQTSIDTRSRLLVELRDDVLTEVTHLYFERRRLQVEEALLPAKELPLQLERHLKLEELTAGIDALTGGYMSKELARGRASSSLMS